MSYLICLANAKSQTDLDGSDTTESPEVAVTNPIKLFLYLLHNAASDVETVIGAVRGLRIETHGSVVTLSRNHKQNYKDDGQVHTCHQSSIPCRKYQSRAKPDGGEQVQMNHLR